MTRDASFSDRCTTNRCVIFCEQLFPNFGCCEFRSENSARHQLVCCRIVHPYIVILTDTYIHLTCQPGAGTFIVDPNTSQYNRGPILNLIFNPSVRHIVAMKGGFQGGEGLLIWFVWCREVLASPADRCVNSRWACQHNTFIPHACHRDAEKNYAPKSTPFELYSYCNPSKWT